MPSGFQVQEQVFGWGEFEPDRSRELTLGLKTKVARYKKQHGGSAPAEHPEHESENPEVNKALHAAHKIMCETYSNEQRYLVANRFIWSLNIDPETNRIHGLFGEGGGFRGHKVKIPNEIHLFVPPKESIDDRVNEALIKAHDIMIREYDPTRRFWVGNDFAWALHVDTADFYPNGARQYDRDQKEKVRAQREAKALAEKEAAPDMNDEKLNDAVSIEELLTERPEEDAGGFNFDPNEPGAFGTDQIGPA